MADILFAGGLDFAILELLRLNERIVGSKVVLRQERAVYQQPIATAVLLLAKRLLINRPLLAQHHPYFPRSFHSA